MKPSFELLRAMHRSLICVAVTFCVSTSYSQDQSVKKPNRNLTLDEIKARNQRIAALKAAHLKRAQSLKNTPKSQAQTLKKQQTHLSSMAVPVAVDQRRRLVSRRVIIHRLPTKKIRPQKYVYNMETGAVRRAPAGKLLPTQVAEDKSSHTNVKSHNIGVKLTAVKPAKVQQKRGIASTP